MDSVPVKVLHLIICIGCGILGYLSMPVMGENYGPDKFLFPGSMFGLSYFFLYILVGLLNKSKEDIKPSHVNTGE